jgi:hypothetical protein
MGAFIDTLLVKAAKPKRVAEVLRGHFPRQRAFVVRRARRWTSVFFDWKGQATGAHDLVDAGRGVCSDCARPGIALRVVDSEAFYWWIFSETGAVISQSCREEAYSNPSEQEQIGLGGDLAAIARLAPEAGLTTDQVRHAIEVHSPGTLERTVGALADLLGAEFGRTSYDDVVAAAQRDAAFGLDALRNDWIYLGAGSPLTQKGVFLPHQMDELHAYSMMHTRAPIVGVGPLTDAATGCATVILVSRAGPDVSLVVWRNPGGLTQLSLDPRSVSQLVNALLGAAEPGVSVASASWRQRQTLTANPS